jgi:hypothetical protein
MNENKTNKTNKTNNIKNDYITPEKASIHQRRVETVVV